MPQRYFIDQSSFKEGIIKGDDAHHISRVMRMKKGDEIIVCHQKKCFISKIIEISECVSFETVEALKSHDAPNIDIIQGLPKGNKIDFVSKYATIYGATNILFVEMQRSISKEKNTENKIKRLHAIAKEAAELAHRFDIPTIDFVKHLKDIDFKSYDVILVADENEKTQTLNDIVKTIDIHLNYAVIIGPEGGITDSERSYFKDLNAQFISLGHNILPTEIASIYALSYFSIKNSE